VIASAAVAALVSVFVVGVFGAPPSPASVIDSTEYAQPPRTPVVRIGNGAGEVQSAAPWPRIEPPGVGEHVLNVPFDEVLPLLIGQFVSEGFGLANSEDQPTERVMAGRPNIPYVALAGHHLNEQPAFDYGGAAGARIYQQILNVIVNESDIANNQARPVRGVELIPPKPNLPIDQEGLSDAYRGQNPSQIGYRDCSVDLPFDIRRAPLSVRCAYAHGGLGALAGLLILVAAFGVVIRVERRH
jgi:hypothetical protein